MIINFQIENKVSKPRYFKGIFLIVNIKFEMILKIFFLKLSNIYILFDKKLLI